MAAPPVAVEVVRGGRVESRHRASLAVVRGERPVLTVGEVTRPVYPRSAIKPIQALPFVADGAADAFGLGAGEIALACASHAGEPCHTERLARWLARLGLDVRDLACGIHPPLAAEVAADLARRGRAPTPLHHNCSGKHLAMLTTARHLGLPVAGYHRPDHPVQERIRELLTRLAGEPPAEPPALDGCSVPTWAMPLVALARAARSFARGLGLTPAEAAAARRILAACRAHPVLLSGRGRPDARIDGVLADGLVKIGAEGVYLGYFPAADLGLALKVEDGGCGRAAPVALLAVLERLGLLDAEGSARLADLRVVPLVNHAGRTVGEIRPAAGWPGASAS